MPTPPSSIDDETSIQIAPGAQLWLEGDSTLHKYSVRAGTFTVRIQADGPIASLGDAAAQKRIRTVEVEVPIAALTSGDAGLDETLRDALRSSAHPKIVFQLDGYEARDDALRLDGKLSIAGVTKPLSINASARQEGDGLRITGAVSLLMTTFGVKPPTKMLGMLKAADKVEVKLDLKLVTAKR